MKLYCGSSPAEGQRVGTLRVQLRLTVLRRRARSFPRLPRALSSAALGEAEERVPSGDSLGRSLSGVGSGAAGGVSLTTSASSPCLCDTSSAGRSK